MTEIVLPEDTNPRGSIFGGRVLALIDKCAAVVAMRHARSQAVTVSLDSVVFLNTVNLGNVLCAAGRAEAAEEHYRLAASQDPAMASAWYNLADVQEAAGRLDEAITSLRRAVEVDPAYADAHYNLALCCTAAGVNDEARRHLQAYLRLDASSPWAQTARRFLAELGAEAARR